MESARIEQRDQVGFLVVPLGLPHLNHLLEQTHGFLNVLLLQPDTGQVIRNERFRSCNLVGLRKRGRRRFDVSVLHGGDPIVVQRHPCEAAVRVDVRGAVRSERLRSSERRVRSCQIGRQRVIAAQKIPHGCVVLFPRFQSIEKYTMCILDRAIPLLRRASLRTSLHIQSCIPDQKMLHVELAVRWDIKVQTLSGSDVRRARKGRHRDAHQGHSLHVVRNPPFPCGAGARPSSGPALQSS